MNYRNIIFIPFKSAFGFSLRSASSPGPFPRRGKGKNSRANSAVKFLFFCILLSYSSVVSSQETRLTETIESIAEQLAADESDPEAAALYTERLSDLAEDPVNINSADEDELSRLFFLTHF